jgi:hypothetical protein
MKISRMRDAANQCMSDVRLAALRPARRRYVASQDAQISAETTALFAGSDPAALVITLSPLILP